jgi:tetratricopeptide (TPR) repeat protein
MNKSRLNLVFGSVVVFLAATGLVGIYLNRNAPAVRDASAPAASGAQLPENHPPIDGANKVLALEQLSRESPDSADYRTQLGNAYYDIGQYEKAIAAYSESLRLRPNDPAVETDLATSYHYLGNHDKALELLDRVLAEHPAFTQALFNKGVILQAGKKDFRGAVGAWESLLRAQPNFPQRAELERKIAELKSGMR